MFLEVSRATYVSDYRIEFEFNNGAKFIVDLEHELNADIYIPLKEQSYFRQFKIQFNTVEWDNGADFAPEYLYDLAKFQHQIACEPNNDYGTNFD